MQTSIIAAAIFAVLLGGENEGKSTAQVAITQPETAPEEAASDDGAGAETEKAETSVQSKKLSPPGGDERKAAEKKIRGVFQQDLAGARTPERRLELTERILEAGVDTTDNSAIRYTLLELAAECATAIGNLRIAVRAIDEIDKGFDVDPLAMKADVLAQLLGSDRPAGQVPAVLKESLRTATSLIDEALAHDRYTMAQRFVDLASTAARKQKNPILGRTLAIRNREIRRLKGQHAVFEEAQEVLKKDPADADANLAAGKWLCLGKGNWQDGLSLLARGADMALAELAKRDLANTEELDERVALGDAWWDLFEKERRAERLGFQQRAVYWYRLALPQSAGLKETRIKNRLRGVHDNLGATVMHLTMDDNAANPTVLDMAAGKHHQTFLDPGGDPNTAAHSVEGPNGPSSRALAFDGVNDRINLGVEWVNEALVAGNDFTFTLWWWNPTGDFCENGVQMVFNSNFVYFYNYKTVEGVNRTTVALRRSVGGSIYPELTDLNDGLWHHYALLRRGTTFEIWLDGVLRTTNTHADNAGNMSTSSFYINSSDTISYGPGAMADFRVYGRALSGGEIGDLFTQ